MKKVIRFFVVACFSLLMMSCVGTTTNVGNHGATSSGGADAKYIFFFIGDGMATSQIRLAEAALTVPEFRSNYQKVTSGESTVEALRLKEMSVTGLATTNAQNRYITCSAAAATALATGNKTDIGFISQSADGKIYTTIAQRAKAKGMKVGVVSSVSIDHATPACFYSHTSNRNNYKEIGDQLLESGFDYFAGGALRWDKRAAADSCDKASAYASYLERAQGKGFKYVATRSEFDGLSGEEQSPVIATLDMLANKQNTTDGSAMPFTIDLCRYTNEDDKISLAEFTAKGVELMEGEQGFFMMVEGGKIDWACHANDAATCAYEVVAFDEAIGVALDFAAQHPEETLIVITGDHDCGGLTIGFAGAGYDSAFEILANTKSSYLTFSQQAEEKILGGESFEKLLAFACEEFGFTNNKRGDTIQPLSSELSDYEVERLRSGYKKSVAKIKKRGAKFDDAEIYRASFGGYDPFTTTCTNIQNNKAGVDFTSYSHTGVPVMVFAEGAHKELFSGYYDNTDIAKKIMSAAGL